MELICFCSTQCQQGKEALHSGVESALCSCFLGAVWERSGYTQDASVGMLYMLCISFSGISDVGPDYSLFLTLVRCSLLETPHFCSDLSLPLNILRHSILASPKGVHRPAPTAYVVPNAPHTSGPASAICRLIFPDVLTSCGCCSKLLRILWLRIA